MRQRLLFYAIDDVVENMSAVVNFQKKPLDENDIDAIDAIDSLKCFPPSICTSLMKYKFPHIDAIDASDATDGLVLLLLLRLVFMNFLVIVSTAHYPI